MRKFKILLFIFLLPISFTMYYFTSDKYGISAYIEKQRKLELMKKENSKINFEIMSYKLKIKQLEKNEPDSDLLKEKAFETLGITEKDNLVINIENL